MPLHSAEKIQDGIDLNDEREQARSFVDAARTVCDVFSENGVEGDKQPFEYEDVYVAPGAQTPTGTRYSYEIGVGDLSPNTQLQRKRNEYTLTLRLNVPDDQSSSLLSGSVQQIFSRGGGEVRNTFHVIRGKFDKPVQRVVSSDGTQETPIEPARATDVFKDGMRGISEQMLVQAMSTNDVAVQEQITGVLKGLIDSGIVEPDTLSVDAQTALELLNEQ